MQLSRTIHCAFYRDLGKIESLTHSHRIKGCIWRGIKLWDMSSMPHKGLNISKSCKNFTKIPNNAAFTPPAAFTQSCFRKTWEWWRMVVWVFAGGCRNGPGGVCVWLGGGEGGHWWILPVWGLSVLPLLQLLDFSQWQFQGRQNELHVGSPRLVKSLSLIRTIQSSSANSISAAIQGKKNWCTPMHAQAAFPYPLTPFLSFTKYLASPDLWFAWAIIRRLGD